MVGHGSKLGRKKEEAIAALVAQRSVEEAALVVNLSPQTLYRWMKIEAFEVAYSEARQALFGQGLARLQKASGTAVTILLNVLYDPKAPAAARLRAADSVLRHTKVARSIGEVAVRLRKVKSAREASLPERGGRDDGEELAGERAKLRKAGHGSKFSRKKEEVIVALLAQRNVEEAAWVVGIGTTTLYRWMKDQEFADACRAARLAAFGRASARLEQASAPAVTTMLRIMADPATPAGIRVRAADLVLEHAIKASEEDIEACLSELNCAGQAGPGALPGGRRTFEESERPRVAA